MSINSLTEIEVRRRVKEKQDGLNGVATVTGDTPPSNGNPVNNALSMLVKYIPTESITLYVAAMSAFAALKGFSSRITEGLVYWFFGILTPILFVLIYLGKRKAAKLKVIPKLGEWPWWKIFAATIAFLVWALAVPGNPFVERDTSGAVAGFFAILISTILSILDPIFDQPAEA